ncbi:hypothetical protein KY339_02745, partial [Candidatus Woesearchaeota archaeon]|nr:hypothetical protein [Candidatus Woesearchaeota archaeon]
ARISAIEREGRNDSEPRIYSGKCTFNWANHWPDDEDDGAYEAYTESCEAYRQRYTERSRKSREIHKEAGEISKWLWENSPGNHKELFEGLDAYYKGVDEEAIRNGELTKLHFWKPRPKNCEEVQMIIPPPETWPCLNLGLDAVEFLIDFGLNKEYHESARNYALRQVNSIENVPDLDSIIHKVINEDIEFSSIFWFSNDTRTILPFFEYPAIVEKWAKRKETRCTQYPFVSMGAKAIPVLLEVMESDEHCHTARHYAAALIGEIDDEENEESLFQMMWGEHAEYAARALMRSKNPAKILHFFEMWDGVDEEDWLHALSIPEAVPQLAATAADKDADSRLRERCVELLTYFTKYEWRREYKAESGISGPLVPEVSIRNQKKIWECFVNGDYPEKIGYETLTFYTWHKDMTAYKPFADAFEIVKDTKHDPKLRIRMMKAIAENMKYVSRSDLSRQGMWDFQPIDYMKKIGSKFWGWRHESNPDVRKAAREALR